MPDRSAAAVCRRTLRRRLFICLHYAMRRYFAYTPTTLRFIIDMVTFTIISTKY